MNSRSKYDLDVLTAVERGETVSQLALSRRVGLAVGLVNALLKRAVRKGYVKIKTAPARRYAYYLTPQGFAEKSRLVSEYIEVSLDFFRQAREQYAELFDRAQSVGFQKIAVAGQGELAEIAVLAAQARGIGIAGIVNRASAPSTLFGAPVVERVDELDEIDAVIVADSLDAQRTYDLLVQRLGRDRVFVPALLRVTEADLVDADPSGKAG